MSSFLRNFPIIKFWAKEEHWQQLWMYCLCTRLCSEFWSSRHVAAEYSGHLVCYVSWRTVMLCKSLNSELCFEVCKCVDFQSELGQGSFLCYVPWFWQSHVSSRHRNHLTSLLHNVKPHKAMMLHIYVRVSKYNACRFLWEYCLSNNLTSWPCCSRALIRPSLFLLFYVGMTSLPHSLLT
jgi:hypothetical protein